MIDMIKNILSIREEISERKNIVVFKGFPYSKLLDLENRFFKTWSKIIVNETDIEDLRSKVLFETIEIMKSDSNVFWMTYEELIVSYEIVKNNFEITILDNNVFNKMYPYDGTVSDIERVYKNY